MKEQLANPFVIGTYAGADYFCDREQETAELISDVNNGRNVVLIAQRRMGKTGLIVHTFRRREIAQRYYTFFIDIFATASLREFVYVFGNAILEQLKPKGKKFLDAFLQTIKSLRPAIRLDAVTGEPSLEVGIGSISSVETTLDEIFDYLNQADKPCLIAFDEFQQIRNYAEQNAEALLRTKIQHTPNAHFIFAGSEPSMLIDMFGNASRPFYQSTFTLHLEAIALVPYTAFARKHFNAHNKQLDTELVAYAYREFEGITLYLQIFMNELFVQTQSGETAGIDRYGQILQSLIRKQNYIYQQLYAELTERQRDIVRAIAMEGTAINVTSAEFINRYNFKSASSIQSALKGLTGKGIVARQRGSYVLNDRLFKAWIKLIVLHRPLPI